MADAQTRPVLLPSHRQMQMAFWWQAQALGAHARVEAYLGAAGYADLLITADLMAERPLVVVEFKDRLEGYGGVHSGMAQARRYRKWLQRTTGFAPAAFLVAPVLRPEVANDFRWRNGDRGVRVTDALGLSAALDGLLPVLLRRAA